MKDEMMGQMMGELLKNITGSMPPELMDRLEPGEFEQMLNKSITEMSNGMMDDAIQGKPVDGKKYEVKLASDLSTALGLTVPEDFMSNPDAAKEFEALLKTEKDGTNGEETTKATANEEEKTEATANGDEKSEMPAAGDASSSSGTDAANAAIDDSAASSTGTKDMAASVAGSGAAASAASGDSDAKTAAGTDASSDSKAENGAGSETAVTKPESTSKSKSGTNQLINVVLPFHVYIGE